MLTAAALKQAQERAAAVAAKTASSTMGNIEQGGNEKANSNDVPNPLLTT